MTRTIQRAALIVALGAALGLVANAVSPRRIPYITPPKAKLDTREIILLDEAKAIWATGLVFFLDARLPADYKAGHIAGALNLPAEHFADRFPSVAPMLSPDTPIIAYCDGVDCELSHQIAVYLRQLGFKNVRVLVNGWTVWRTAGLATQQGMEP